MTTQQGFKASSAYKVPISTVEVVVALKRKSFYCVYIFTLPSAFISFLTLVAICSADSARKSSLEIALFVALIVLLLMLAQRVPISDTIPIIGKS